MFDPSDELMRRLREANEQLLSATFRAEDFAAEAERARVLAVESEERFRSLVLASSAIVWRADAGGRIAFEPEVWFTLTGFALSGEGGGSNSWLDAVHVDDRGRISELWRTAVDTSTGYACEHRLLRKAGGYGWVAARAVPIRRNGVAREWIGMMTDISERKEMERAREQFMAILGHDLQSPLAAISISAEALQRCKLEPPFGYLVDEIKKTATTMSELVRDVMDFARGRLAGGIPLVLKSCDLVTLCTDVVAQTTCVYPDRSITIAASGALVGEWDARRLSQAIANLLTNAVAHGRDPIAVTLSADSDSATVCVTNHGPTIPHEKFATLFEPFRRASDARVLTRGLGLGLYIVSEIVRAHGGTITVSSANDITTFVLRIPRTNARST